VDDRKKEKLKWLLRWWLFTLS